MEKKPVIAVILSGCGAHDGSEIRESVLSLLAIERNGAKARCFAPDIVQNDVINHLTGEPSNETRNVLVESARIARGEITDLADFNASEVDAILFPGGMGAIKNLSSIARHGADASITPFVLKALKSMRQAKKPIGALCISPAMLAVAFGDVTVTIGDDTDTAAMIEKSGSQHQTGRHGDAIIDEKAKIVTAPAYMLASTLSDIEADADSVVKGLLSFLKRNA